MAIEEWRTKPVKAALPTARYLPFQSAGNHSSILISESGVGVRVNCTRQNAGRVSYLFAAFELLPGGAKAPAAICSVEFTSTFTREKSLRLSQDWAAASGESTLQNTSANRYLTGDGADMGLPPLIFIIGLLRLASSINSQAMGVHISILQSTKDKTD